MSIIQKFCTLAYESICLTPTILKDWYTTNGKKRKEKEREEDF
jgi:hypothetical protein